VVNTVKKTVETTRDAWDKHKVDYPISRDILERIDEHMKKLAL